MGDDFRGGQCMVGVDVIVGVAAVALVAGVIVEEVVGVVVIALFSMDWSGSAGVTSTIRSHALAKLLALVPEKSGVVRSEVVV